MYRIPKHIGIIPDGNRRWASSRGLGKEEGYAFGLEPGLRLLKAAKKSGIQELTYYGFTVDNCKRPRKQVQAFSEACIKAVQMIEKENVQLSIVGNTDSVCFPKELLAYTDRGISNDSAIYTKNGTDNSVICTKNGTALKSLPPREEDSDRMRVNFLVNYGWEWDMKNNWASRKIPRVDMVIRWGGMCRLSGFLPIQTVYSDFYIIPDLWPDFQEQQFEDALVWYQKQDVTLGG